MASSPPPSFPHIDSTWCSSPPTRASHIQRLFIVFYPLHYKITGGEKTSKSWGRTQNRKGYSGDELGGDELGMGQNRYHSLIRGAWSNPTNPHRSATVNRVSKFWSSHKWGRGKKLILIINGVRESGCMPPPNSPPPLLLGNCSTNVVVLR